MNEIIEHNGNQSVNARNLHAALKAGRDFSNWIKDRIEKYGFEEGEDYHLARFGEVVARRQCGEAPKEARV
jgi:phage anti-repressor protein